jgi:hypothetical protein
MRERRGHVWSPLMQDIALMLPPHDPPAYGARCDAIGCAVVDHECLWLAPLETAGQPSGAPDRLGLSHISQQFCSGCRGFRDMEPKDVASDAT